MEMAAYYGMALLYKRACWSIDGWRRDAAPVLPNEAGGVPAGTLRSQLLMSWSTPPPPSTTLSSLQRVEGCRRSSLRLTGAVTFVADG